MAEVFAILVLQSYWQESKCKSGFIWVFSLIPLTPRICCPGLSNSWILVLVLLLLCRTYNIKYLKCLQNEGYTKTYFHLKPMCSPCTPRTRKRQSRIEGLIWSHTTISLWRDHRLPHECVPQQGQWPGNSRRHLLSISLSQENLLGNSLLVYFYLVLL